MAEFLQISQDFFYTLAAQFRQVVINYCSRTHERVLHRLESPSHLREKQIGPWMKKV